MVNLRLAGVGEHVLLLSDAHCEDGPVCGVWALEGQREAGALLQSEDLEKIYSACSFLLVI